MFNTVLQVKYSKDTSFHFIGIGGAGMSTLAFYLMSAGYKVKGSDVNAHNEHLQKLKQAGAEVYIGHSANNISAKDTIVTTNVIHSDNPELEFAMESKLPIVRRSSLLADVVSSIEKSVCITGCHGKSTATAMTVDLIGAMGLPVSFVNGAKIRRFNSFFRCDQLDAPIIAEADESDTLLGNYKFTIGVILNIEPEHMEAHGGRVENLINVFYNFAKGQKPGGAVLACIDSPLVRDNLIPLVKSDKSINLITFGLSSDADIVLTVGQMTNKGAIFSFYDSRNGQNVQLQSNSFGVHGVMNTFCASYVAYLLGSSFDVISQYSHKFAGVAKRFDIVNSSTNYIIIDDYAHHPTEIKATLEAISQKYETSDISIVFEPHKYTRLHDHFDGYAEALKMFKNALVVPVFHCNQKPIQGSSAEDLVGKIGPTASYVDSLDIEYLIKKANPQPNSVLVFATAGKLGENLRSYFNHK